MSDEHAIDRIMTYDSPIPEWNYRRIVATFGQSLCIKISHLRGLFKHPLDRLEVIKEIIKQIRELSFDGKVPGKDSIRDFFGKLLPHLELLAESEFNLANMRYAELRAHIEKITRINQQGDHQLLLNEQKKMVKMARTIKETKQAVGSVRQELHSIELGLQEIMKDDNPLEDSRRDTEDITRELQDSSQDLNELLEASGYRKRK